ncbi:MAG: ATP-binding cassette domain-containing protein, partial [Candidatus Pacebacteria bacterium]|nr:ATP-binding cassette domain-containing protein [Candidatus Paceibacterota bacterium]
PQGRHIFPSLTVLENLTIGQRKGKTSGHWSLERVYSFFPILRVRANSSAKFLSGGEQQMVSIARALMTNAQMILMDEPSEGLAPLIIREIGDIIGQLKKEKISFLLVEQSLYLAYTAGDYVYIIDKGRNVYDSTVDELRLNEEAQVKFLFVKK